MHNLEDMNSKKLLYPLFLLFFSLMANAQSERLAIHEEIGWFRLYNHIGLGSNWSVRSEAEERFGISASLQPQYLLRTHLSRSLGDGWSVALGFSYFAQTLPADAGRKRSLRPELRPQQEIAYRFRASRRLSVSQRFWLEERLKRRMDGEGHLTGGYSPSFRLRYLVKGKFTLIHQPTRRGELSLLAFDELFLNLESNAPTAFNLNLLGVSLAYGITPNLVLEAGYINWFQPAATPQLDYQRNIFRLTIHRYWELGGKD